MRSKTYLSWVIESTEITSIFIGSCREVIESRQEGTTRIKERCAYTEKFSKRLKQPRKRRGSPLQRCWEREVAICGVANLQSRELAPIFGTMIPCEELSVDEVSVAVSRFA